MKIIKFFSLEEINEELHKTDNEIMQLATRFASLAEKIKYIFSQIASCTSMEETDDYFELLDNIQSALAKALFQHDIGLPERLRRFVRDFDNIEFYKDHYFSKIMSGEYTF